MCDETLSNYFTTQLTAIAVIFLRAKGNTVNSITIWKQTIFTDCHKTKFTDNICKIDTVVLTTATSVRLVGCVQTPYCSGGQQFFKQDDLGPTALPRSNQLEEVVILNDLLTMCCSVLHEWLSYTAVPNCYGWSEVCSQCLCKTKGVGVVFCVTSNVLSCLRKNSLAGLFWWCSLYWCSIWVCFWCVCQGNGFSWDVYGVLVF